MAAKCWLWPNRIINKTFSGKLREEHNEAVNEHDIMKRALQDIAKASGTDEVLEQVKMIAEATLKRLKL